MTFSIKSLLKRLTRPETRAMKYGYSNARVRGMKGTLLKPGFFEELVRVKSIEGMAELLQRTGYRNDLATTSATYRGSMLINAAASLNFASTVRKVVHVTPESDRRALRALLVMWDLMNIKTLLHARRLKKGYDEVKPHLFEVGELTGEDFKRIIKADDAGLTKELGRTELGRRMLAAVPSQGKGRKEKVQGGPRAPLVLLQEGGIDSFVYAFRDQVLSEIGGNDVAGLRRLLRQEVNARNIMVIERLKKHSIPREKIEASLIGSGTLDRDKINRLLDARDVSTVVGIAKQEFPHLELKSDGKVGLAELEIMFERSIARQKLAMLQRQVLSLGVIMGFLLLKEEEVNNLRKIAKGKEFEMTEEEVRDMLVLV